MELMVSLFVSVVVVVVVVLCCQRVSFSCVDDVTADRYWPYAGQPSCYENAWRRDAETSAAISAT